MTRVIHFTDELEKDIADLLDKRGIEFVHESEFPGQRLDFFLPGYEIYIEVKKYYSDRVLRQMEIHDNVIVVQGKKAVAFLKAIL